MYSCQPPGPSHAVVCFSQSQYINPHLVPSTWDLQHFCHSTRFNVSALICSVRVSANTSTNVLINNSTQVRPWFWRQIDVADVDFADVESK